jgi:putative sterol carrier protein
MSLESATENLKGNIKPETALGAKVKFDFGGDGMIFVDGSAAPATVSNDDSEADCTIKIALEDFESMLSGELNPTTAFMSGKLSVDGDMSVAMKLGEIMG